MGIERLPPNVPGFEVNVKNVIVWIIRDMRIHGSLPDVLLFNFKIDGRPFFGKCVQHNYVMNLRLLLLLCSIRL